MSFNNVPKLSPASATQRNTTSGMALDKDPYAKAPGWGSFDPGRIISHVLLALVEARSCRLSTACGRAQCQIKELSISLGFDPGPQGMWTDQWPALYLWASGVDKIRILQAVLHARETFLQNRKVPKTKVNYWPYIKRNKNRGDVRILGVDRQVNWHMSVVVTKIAKINDTVDP